jgi:hypothetical protein
MTGPIFRPRFSVAGFCNRVFLLVGKKARRYGLNLADPLDSRRTACLARETFVGKFFIFTIS